MEKKGRAEETGAVAVTREAAAKKGWQIERREIVAAKKIIKKRETKKGQAVKKEKNGRIAIKKKGKVGTVAKSGIVPNRDEKRRGIATVKRGRVRKGDPPAVRTRIGTYPRRDVSRSGI